MHDDHASSFSCYRPHLIAAAYGYLPIICPLVLLSIAGHAGDEGAGISPLPVSTYDPLHLDQRWPRKPFCVGLTRKGFNGGFMMANSPPTIGAVCGFRGAGAAADMVFDHHRP